MDTVGEGISGRESCVRTSQEPNVSLEGPRGERSMERRTRFRTCVRYFVLFPVVMVRPSALSDPHLMGVVCEEPASGTGFALGAPSAEAVPLEPVRQREAGVGEGSR